MTFLLGFIGWSKAIPCSDPDGTLQPDSTDCSFYYVCSNGELIHSQCPIGLHFNPIAHVCDYPESAGCEITQTTTTDDGSTVSTTTDDSSSTDSTIDDLSSTDTTRYDSTTTETTVMCDTEVPTETTPEAETTTATTEEPNDQECPATGIIFLPNPDDCNKYYECVNGAKFEFSCPPDLHFDPVKLTCDWPELAGCDLNNVTESKTMKGWNARIVNRKPVN